MSKYDESIIFYINSTDRISGGNADFQYKLPLPINNNYDRICLLQCSLPKTYYTVVDGRNYFGFQEGTGVITPIYVPVGNYTKQSLALTLKPLLEAASILHGHNHTYTITYPDINTENDDGKYTITVSNNGGMQFTFYIYDKSIIIHEMLGFMPDGVYTSVANILKSNHVIDMQPFNSIAIHTDLVNNDIGSDFNSNDILQQIFVSNNDPPYSTVYYQCNDVEAFSHKLSSNSKQVCRFFLTDEDDIPISLNSNNIEFTIMLYKKNKSSQLLTGFIKYCTTWLELMRKKLM